jgi:hypothetical protein
LSVIDQIETIEDTYNSTINALHYLIIDPEDKYEGERNQEKGHK